MLELKGISKYYNVGSVNEMCLFQNFNLNIEKGEFLSVVGSNGSGKTSMLNIICGSIPVESGQILIGDTDITKEITGFGTVEVKVYINGIMERQNLQMNLYTTNSWTAE